MQILISGVCGYIGSILAPKLLDMGYRVLGYDNCSGRTSDSILTLFRNPNFEFMKADVLDTDKLQLAKEKCDFIVHLAAMVGEPVCSKYVLFSQLTNELGTLNIVKTGKKLPIIFASTGSVYGKVEGICTEESPTNPLSVYARSKLVAENHVREHTGLNHIIYRFATAFGLSPALRLDLLPNDFTYQALKNKSLTVFQADFRRTFCHVQDIASAIAFGIKHFEILKGKVYNVGNSKGNWTKRQLAEFLKFRTGCAVFYGDEGYKDPDLRDYETSYSAINKEGWYADVSMKTGVSEMIRAFPAINPNSQYVQRL